MGKRKSRTRRARPAPRISPRQLLARDDAAGFLFAVSALIQGHEDRPADTLDLLGAGMAPLHANLRALAAHDSAETTATLAAMAHLIGDPAAREFCRGVVQERAQPVAPWLASLGEARSTGVVRMWDSSGDVDLWMVGLHHPGGGDVTFLVLVDHNLDGAVKHVVLSDRPLSEVRASMQAENESVPDPFATWIEQWSAAQARAVIERGLAVQRGLPPLRVTECWPYCRPWLEFALSKLPPGDPALCPVPWSDEQLDTLVAEFLRSPEVELCGGWGVEPEELLELVEGLVALSVGCSSGNPMRWSPARIALLTELLLPAVGGLGDHLAEVLPHVLEGYVRFCGREAGTDPAVVEATSESVRELTSR